MPTRGRNYQPFEDVLLCQAYVGVSQDAPFINDQTSDEFWSRVAALWKNKLEEYTLCGGEEKVDRDMFSLNNRFKRHIQFSVSKFVSYCNMANRDAGSGRNDPETIHANAKALYKNHMKKEFDNQACWDVLRAMPKFSTHSGKGDDGSAFTNVPSTSDRPEGTKAAKRKAKMQEVADKKAKTLHSLQGDISKMSEAIVGYCMDQKVKDQEQRLMTMAKFYRDMGDNVRHQDFMMQLATFQSRPRSDIPLAVQTNGTPTSPASSEDSSGI
ncbi:MAG: hypothetical protein SGBAC_008726 [Bacillariaceae sp.]